MNQIEAILTGETEEEKKNPDCWIHQADYGENIPEYMKQHERNRIDAELEELEYETKYREEIV